MRIFGWILLIFCLISIIGISVFSKSFRSDLSLVAKEYLFFKPFLRFLWRIYGRVVFIDRNGNLLDSSLTISVETRAILKDSREVELLFSDSTALLLSKRPDLKEHLTYKPGNFPRLSELNCIADIIYFGPRRGLHLLHVFIVQDEELVGKLNPKNLTKKQLVQHALLEELLFGTSEEDQNLKKPEALLPFCQKEMPKEKTLLAVSVPSRVIFRDHPGDIFQTAADAELIEMALKDKGIFEEPKKEEKIVTMEMVTRYHLRSPVVGLLENKDN